MNQNILEGMARAFFACAWADQAEEEGISLQGEIMDQIPLAIDPAAMHAAHTLYMDFERNLHDAHGEHDTLCGDFVREYGVDKMEGVTLKEREKLFGHYAAMQAMGHGVGLWEYCAHQISDHVPYTEFGSYSLERDYFLGGVEL